MNIGEPKRIHTAEPDIRPEEPIYVPDWPVPDEAPVPVELPSEPAYVPGRE
jgi:hypothetical protein